MNNEIEKAYYQQMIKDELIIYDVKEFESLKDHEKRWFTDTIYFKLFVVRWHFIRLCEQIKSKLFNSQNTHIEMENNLSGCRGIVNGLLIVAALAAIAFLVFR